MAVEAARDPYAMFHDRVATTPGLDVLELGTRRIDGNPSTVRRSLAHPKSRYVTSDVAPGEDVDVVADAHRLTETFAPESFDMVWACSVFEHLARPWIAACAMAAVTRTGGWVFVHTHQAFPLHAFPHDYFRFSREALELLFKDAGMHIIGSAYQFPARVVSETQPDLATAEAWLNVVILAEKR